MQLQDMDLTCDFEAIKVAPMPTIQAAFLVMALHRKLPRPAYKSYVNDISLCQACFLKLKFSWLKIF